MDAVKASAGLAPDGLRGWIQRLRGRASSPSVAGRLIAPLAVLLVLASAALTGIIYLIARDSDQRQQIAQRQALTAALDEFRTVFADFTLGRATDIAAFVWQSQRPSVAEIGNRLAPTGLSRYRHERAYLLAGDGTLIAAFPPGTSDAPTRVKQIATAFRAEDTLRRQRTADAPALYAASIQPVTADYIAIDGEPAVMAVATVRSPSLASHGSGDLPVLVAMARLDLTRTHVFEATSGVTGLRVNGEAAATGTDSLVIADRDGRIVGWFSWDAQGPVLAMVLRLAPLLGAVGLALLGLAVLSVWQVRGATRRLGESERRAHALAYQDPLTRLPNLRRLNEEIDRALAARAPGEIVAFGYLDLDNFSEVNESLGHSGGDRLLMMAADRLGAAFGPDVVLGRCAQDRFALVMRTRDPDAGNAAAEHAIACMAQPFWINGQMLHNGVSIGLAEVTDPGVQRDELVMRADLALRAAKGQGGGRVVCFKPAMEEESHDRRFIKRELQRAVAEGTLDLHYQPIVGAADGRTVGVEALLRWEHPSRGAIPPSVFVPIAEQTGLMEALGEFVLRRALADAQQWPSVYIAINLSPVQVRSSRLVPLVSRILSETGIASSRVVLEVTEGVLIDDPADAKVKLDALRALGVRMALDDFGVGYSSLGYLQRFNFDKLKIDRSFVAPLGRSADAAAMVQAIVALGRALGLSVLAEGVETDEQRVLLRLAGCDEMQGFRFARPMPREAVDALFAKRKARLIASRNAIKA
jgi:diguanylate cyclase (GGDEF)-like protein